MTHPQTKEIIAAYLNGGSRETVARQFGISQSAVRNVLSQNNIRLTDAERAARMKKGSVAGGIAAAGLGGANLRPVPDDFATLAPTMLKYELLNHYNTGDNVLRRWLRETGATPKVATWRKPCPDDFARVAPTMSKAQLSKHFGANNEAINRWLGETGTTAAKPQPGNYTNHRRPVNARHVRSTITPYDGRSEATPYDDALFILRKINPVYRCNDKGGFDLKGKFFRIGASAHVMTGDELLARAERHRERGIAA